MKKLVLLLIVLLLSGCSNLDRLTGGHKQSNANEKTYLVVGDSLAENWVRGYEATALTYSISGRVYVSEDPNNNYPSKIFCPTKENPTQWSIPYLYLGERMVVENGIAKVTFINVGHGAASAEKWDSGIYGESLFDLVRQYKPDAILYTCGGAEARWNFEEEGIYQHLKSIIMKTRAVSPRLPWYVSLTGNPGDYDTSPRRAEKRIISEGLATQGPDVDLLRANPNNIADDGTHFGKDGFKSLGDEWFSILRGWNSPTI